MTIAIISGLIFLLLTYWLAKRREEQKRLAENEVRASLGLPPLTRGQFGLEVVEKSADFRSNINQHM